MRYRFKRSIIFIMLIILVITQVPITSLADTVGDNSNTGSGSGGVQTGGFTWNESQSGYRFTIVDRNLKPVSRSVDILFSEPTQNFGNDRYTNPRTSLNLSTSNSNWVAKTFQEIMSTDKTIDKAPPVPIQTVNGTAFARGDEFKQWFLNGKGSFSIPKPPPVYTPSTGKNTSRPSSNSKPSNQSNPGGTTGNVKDPPAPEDPNRIFAREYSEAEWLFVNAVVLRQRNNKNESLSTSASTVLNNMIRYGLIEASTTANKNNIISGLRKANVSQLITLYGMSGQLVKVDIPYHNVNDTILAKTDNISYELIPIDRIPLAKDSGDNGYAEKILNYKVNGKYLFELKGVDMSKYTGIIDAMSQLGYDLVVEPVFWFVPAKYSNGKPINPHKNYIYGTVSNLIQFHGSKYGSTGGAYATILSKIGFRSMYTGENWPKEGSTKIKKYNATSASSVPVVDLQKRINNQEGLGLHIYLTEKSETDSQQTTRDNSKGKNPHPAPDPTSLENPKDDTKQYKIVKYYESEKDGAITRSKHVRNNNPPSIRIENEPEYLVQEWFISKSTSDGKNTYEESKKLGYTKIGTLTQTVTLKKGSEKTLHVLLVKKEGTGDLTLRESEISKAITTMSTDIPNWGPREFKFKVPSMAGTSSGSLSFFYNIVNIATVDKRIEALYGDLFKPQMINSAMEGEVPIGGWTADIPEAEYRTTIWRGDDIPTIAAYKEPNNNLIKNIKGLLGRYGNTPQGDRYTNGGYTKDLNIQLGLSDDSILTTRGVKHQYNNVAPHKGKATVKVYRGETKPKGNITVDGTLTTNGKIGKGKYTSTGLMIQNKTPIKFYPYVRMSYQYTNQADRNEVYVLSNQISEILPNDYVEIISYTPDAENSLIITSTQWSTHKRAVEGTDGWQGHNQVLPGGAIYLLANGERLPEVRVETWQTIIDSNERSALSVGLGSNDYTLDTATQEHDNLADRLKDSLEGLKVVQWVNGDHKAANAWTGSKAVKVEGGGESLTKLGLNNKTSSSKKHYLTASEGADSPYIDVVGSLKNDNVYFKIFADTQGNIYLSYSSSLNSLKNATGDSPYISTVTTEKILSKAEKVDKLTGWALEIDNKTKAITNLLRVLERNAGNDPNAEWAPDGKWFNEAWDGIYLVRQTTRYSIGFNDPKVRTAALDPNLTPKSIGKGDIFTKAHLSQFRVEAPDSITVGSFKGKIITLEGLNGILETKKFYIPNANVQSMN